MVISIIIISSTVSMLFGCITGYFIGKKIKAERDIDKIFLKMVNSIEPLL